MSPHQMASKLSMLYAKVLQVDAPHQSLRQRLMWVSVFVLSMLSAIEWWALPYVQSLLPQQQLLIVVLRVVVYVLLIQACVWLVLQPILRLSHALHDKQRSDGVLESAVPLELDALVDGINDLLRDKQESVAAQQKFLADTSHQLKTPLAVLRAQIQGSMAGCLDIDVTLRKMLQTVDQSTEMINQFLSMAKVEQIARHANWVEVDLSSVARDVSMQMTPLILEKQIALSLDGDSFKVKTDRWMVAELIKNLLSNAIHHCAPQGNVGIVMRSMPSGPEMLIWDTGGGLDEAVKERLFQPFQSASGPNGVGLGLSICRQIALSMHADIQIFNRIRNDAVVGVDALVSWPVAPAVGDAAT
jgi:signal transduction histidine kinase